MKNIVAEIQALPEAYLKVGEGGIYEMPCVVKTVLGSCVSVSFFSSAHCVGGMFHALLPGTGLSTVGLPSNEKYRFVGPAIEHICNEMFNKGIRRDQIETKVFGGASVMQSGFNVGRRNVEEAYSILEKLHLRVVASNVGGEFGRKLLFRTDTGEVFLKRLSNRSVTPNCHSKAG